MPYVVTQGDINTALENAFNKGSGGRPALQVRLDTLNDLLASVPVGKCGGFLSDAIADHIDEHWFGVDPISRDEGETWWVNWEGPAEEVARRGMTAGLAISLGLPADDRGRVEEAINSGGAETQLHWIDFSWICPVPRFQFWVSWRDMNNAAGDRAVTVTMATPGGGQYTPPVGLAPIFQSGGDLATELENNYGPLKATPAPNGHIVVGAERVTTTDRVTELSVDIGLPNFSWRITLAPMTVAEGDVVICRPPDSDGINDDGTSDDNATREDPR